MSQCSRQYYIEHDVHLQGVSFFDNQQLADHQHTLNISFAIDPGDALDNC
jgi:hypothetical protein